MQYAYLQVWSRHDDEKVNEYGNETEPLNSMENEPRVKEDFVLGGCGPQEEGVGDHQNQIDCDWNGQEVTGALQSIMI